MNETKGREGLGLAQWITFDPQNNSVSHYYIFLTFLICKRENQGSEKISGKSISETSTPSREMDTIRVKGMLKIKNMVTR